MKSVKYWAASILAVVWLAALGATGVQAQGKSSGAKIRLATPSASLSYLPIHVALQKGFFARRGFRYRSHSDGRGFGSAGAAQPGD
jgi:ABC-type nitrate/sulfonate/bicarbonate transport system substrate-binding protein